MQSNPSGVPSVFPLFSNETRAESFASSGTPPSTLGVQSSSSASTSDARVENPSPATTSDASTPANIDYSVSRPSNIVTEFTKRKGWSGLIIQGFRDIYFILTGDLKFKYSAPSAYDLLGYSQDELVGKDIVDVVHPHDRPLLESEFKEGAANKHQLWFYFRFQKKDGSYAMLECHAHCVDTNVKGDGLSNLFFFVNARPYPTKSGALLDSFLEHKIENLRLKRRIEDLRREEAEEYAEEQRLSSRRQLGSELSVSGASGNTRSTGDSNLSRGSSSLGMPTSPNFMSHLGLNALTRQNLSKVDAASASRSDNIRDKMARFKGDAHLEEIEMRTGLLLREGERSNGISIGGHSPSLIRGDLSVKSPLDRDRDESDKKKKVKFTEEYVCRDCGTLESPEWRKGPQGPKSLCNACGLRWAKQEKRRNSLPNVAGSN